METTLLSGYTVSAVLAFLALQADIYGATPYQWVSTLGIAGTLLIGLGLWYFKVKEPRDAKENQAEIARAVASGEREAERAIASAAASQKVYEMFLEKQEERHSHESNIRLDHFKEEINRSHETFRLSLDSIMGRMDVYNKGLSDFKAEVRAAIDNIKRGS